jgi:hypothetical protein
LTILRASHSGSDIVDEADLEKRLGAKAPSGFYMLDHDNKICAAFFPNDVHKGAKPPSLDVSLWGADLGEHLSNPCWSTRVTFDIEKMGKAQDPFADWLLLDDEAKKTEGLTLHGLHIESVISGWGSKDLAKNVILGYPAPIEFKAEWEVTAGEKALMAKSQPGFAPSMSTRMKLGDLWRLPFFNHNAVSPISNTRDIREINERVKERADIIRVLAKEWLAQSKMLAGDLDYSLVLTDDETPGSAARQVKRQQAVDRSDMAPLGKPRAVYFAPNKTTFTGPDDNRIILSADIALVDGQHSSRDYWLIAHGLAGATPEVAKQAILDCTPEKLEKVFQDEIKRLIQEEPSSTAARYKFTKTASAERFAYFCNFCAKKTSQIDFRPVYDPEMARVKTLIENEQRQQEKEDKALAECHDEIQDYVAAFNRGASLSGDLRRLTGIKSAHANVGFSARDLSLNVDVKKIFRALTAIANPEKSFAARLPSTRDRDTEAALAYAEQDVKDMFPLLKGEERAQVKAKFVAFYESQSGLKGRDFDLTSDRLIKTLDHIAAGAGKKRVHGKAFVDVINTVLSKRFNVQAKACLSDEHAKNAYLLGLSAIEISQVLNLNWAPTTVADDGSEQRRMDDERINGNASLAKKMTQSTLDSVVLRLAVDRYREGAGEDLSMASSSMVKLMEETMDRLRARAYLPGQDGIVQVNRTRDAVAADIKNHVEQVKAAKVAEQSHGRKTKDKDALVSKIKELEKPRGFIKEHQRDVATIYDAISLPGDSFSLVEKRHQKLKEQQLKEGQIAKTSKQGKAKSAKKVD